MRNKKLSTKVIELSQIEQTLAFTEYDFYVAYSRAFETQELGSIRKRLSLGKMAEKMGLMESSRKKPSLRMEPDRKAFFTPEGKAALVFLKMYTDVTCYESQMRI